MVDGRIHHHLESRPGAARQKQKVCRCTAALQQGSVIDPHLLGKHSAAGQSECVVQGAAGATQQEQTSDQSPGQAVNREYCAARPLSSTIGATSLKHVTRYRWQPCWEAQQPPASCCVFAAKGRARPARPGIKVTCTHSLLTPIVSCLRGYSCSLSQGSGMQPSRLSSGRAITKLGRQGGNGTLEMCGVNLAAMLSFNAG